MTLFKQLSCLYLHRIRLAFSTFEKNQFVKTKLRRQEFFNNILKTFEEKYTDILKAPETEVAKETWENVRNDILTLHSVNPNNIDTVIMDIFENQKYFDAGISYYNFLKTNNYDCSIFTTGKYLKFYGCKEDSLTEAQKDEIKNVCNTLLEKYPMLNEFISNVCILSLCKAGDWKKSIELINKFEAYDPAFLNAGHSALINCLFESENVELAHEYLHKTFQKSNGPANYVYSTYIKYALKDQGKFQENMEKLFQIWRDYDIKPHINVINEYINVCNEIGWTANITAINQSKCQRCQQDLSEASLSPEEFKYLSETIMKKLLVERGYLATHPKELKQFLEFVEATKPYDIVIDALNVLYSTTNMTKTFNYDFLYGIIEHFKDKGQKVVIIARKHILRSERIQSLRGKAYFFLLDNLSKDDAFTLYAALAGGRQTKFVSCDLMRQHKFALQDIQLGVLFKRWQILHQYAYANNTLIPMKKHLGCYIDASVQKQSNCWHIPFQFNTPIQRLQHTNPTHWACFQICTK